jgi:hypothetical protein
LLNLIHFAKVFTIGGAASINATQNRTIAVPAEEEPIPGAAMPGLAANRATRHQNRRVAPELMPREAIPRLATHAAEGVGMNQNNRAAATRAWIPPPPNNYFPDPGPRGVAHEDGTQPSTPRSSNGTPPSTHRTFSNLNSAERDEMYPPELLIRSPRVYPPRTNSDSPLPSVSDIQSSIAATDASTISTRPSLRSDEPSAARSVDTA